MATHDARLRPRKTPRQQRSRETRAVLLDAAARVFGAHGYAAGTTNRIAETAGVSIGTLYQYFPNKDAILAELMQAHVEEGAMAVQQRLAGGLPDALDERLELFVRAAVESHVGNRRLHQVLFEESPRPRPLLERLHELEAAAVEAVAALLRDDPAVTVADHRLAAWTVIAAIESLTHRFVAASLDVDVDDFVAEVVTMLAAYLTAPRGAAP